MTFLAKFACIKKKVCKQAKPTMLMCRSFTLAKH